MTNGVIQFLKRSGLQVEAKDKENPKLTAFRRNIHFPELLFDLGLSGHKEERFLIKIESQDQGIVYSPVITNIKGCGFFFPFPVPSDGVLCSMKIAAMLARAKGRDFYSFASTCNPERFKNWITPFVISINSSFDRSLQSKSKSSEKRSIPFTKRRFVPPIKAIFWMFGVEER